MYRKLYSIIALCLLSVGVYAQNLATGTLSGSTFCACASINVPFTMTGNANAGNVYTAELSDASGSFASPVVIGTLSSTALTGDVAATIPCSTAAGTGYRIRVVSSDDAETGTDNGTDITINASVTATISISANPGTTTCAGTAVTYSATLTNEGSTPGYYWQKNGIYVTSNATYTNNTPANGDDVFCVLTTSAQCPVSAMVNSNHLIQTVNPNLTPSVSIVSDAVSNGACVGATVTFTATPVNGGAAPTYQWKQNGSNVGTNSATYSTNSLSQGDVISVVMTSNATCLAVATATSNSIQMNIGSPVTPSVSITPAPGTTICNGVAVGFSPVPVNGGIAPTYVWTRNGSPVSTGTTYSNPGNLANGDVIAVTMTSNAPCPATPTASNSVTMTVVMPTVPTISISANPGSGLICSGTSITFTATAGNTGAAPKYQWKRNGTNVGTNSATYTSSALANFDVITCVVTSDAFCPASTTSNALTMNITPTLTPSATIISNVGNPSCQGAVVTFSAQPYAGGPNPSYQWKVDGVNTGTNSPYLTDNGTLSTGAHSIVCVVTTDYVCPSAPTGTGTLNFTVNPILTPSVSIASPAAVNGNICGNASVTFTATPVNGGSGPQYQWKKNGVNIATGVSYAAATTLAAGDVISCEMTSNQICTSPLVANSNSVTIAHYPITSASVSITSPYGPIACQGLPVNFVATPSNPGAAPTYQWKKNGVNIVGATAPTYSATMTGGENIVCEMRSSTICATPVPAVSNTLAMTVSPITAASVNMYVTNDSVACEGEPFMFTSYFTNAGTTPAFRWFVNGTAIPGANQSTYTSSALANNDVITVEMSSSAACVFPVLSTPISVEVLTTDTPKVSIVGNKSASGYTFYATMINGGTTPSYVWRKNGVEIPGATTDVYTTANLLPNDKISVTAGSSLMCVYPQFVQSNTILVSDVTSVKTVAGNVGSLRLFPNPNDGNFTIKAAVKTTNTDATVEVLNAVGQVVFRNTVPVQGAEFATDINLGNNAAAGMYLVRLHIDGQVSTLRFVVK